MLLVLSAGYIAMYLLLDSMPRLECIVDGVIKHAVTWMYATLVTFIAVMGISAIREGYLKAFTLFFAASAILDLASYSMFFKLSFEMPYATTLFALYWFSLGFLVASLDPILEPLFKRLYKSSAR